MWKNTYFHDCGNWGVGEERLPVCGVLVLTHNFEVWRLVVARLLVFWDWGLWLQRGQWQNCKSKQAVRFDFLLFTGLKPGVNMCRSYGTFLIREKGFVRYYLITGLKPVVNMCRSYGTYYLVSVFLLFNLEFWGLETSCSLVVSVCNLWVVVSERTVAKL